MYNPNNTTDDFEAGQVVEYIPDHAESSEDTEIGVISTIKPDDNHNVFVRYFRKVKIDGVITQNRSILQNTAQLTDVRYLRNRSI